MQHLDDAFIQNYFHCDQSPEVNRKINIITLSGETETDNLRTGWVKFTTNRRHA